MSTQTGRGQSGIPIDLSSLESLAKTCRDSYRGAAPWPHLVLDDLINPATIAAAESQELEPALSLEMHGGNRMVKAESSEVTGQAARDILESLIAPEFVGFLEKLTGIEGLIADPTHTWAGIHVCPVGSSQAVHRDFRLHPTNGLYHRVNVLVYLNTIWKEEYGGELELWPSDMSACGKQVLPIAGRVVIFETTPSTCHGVPDPIRCPPEIARLSLASYYYTDYPSPVDRRSPLFLAPRRPQDPWYMRFQPLHESMYRLWRVFVQSLTRRSVKPRSTDEIGE